MNDFLLPINGETKVTYINQITNEKWEKWKKFSELNSKEKEKINLGMPTKNYIIFDKDLNIDDDLMIKKEYEEFKKSLFLLNIKHFLSDRTPHGFHVFCKFKELDKLDDNVAREVRRIYVNKLECDEAKISLKGVVSLPNRPHFKTNTIYEILDNIEGENDLYLLYIEQAKQQVERNKETLTKINFDGEFKNYFDSDPFFLYLKNNIIPDGTSRDMTIFPNLAIASVKSSKTDEEIKNILTPLFQTNFPNKSYLEFEGWLRKARRGDITDYNPIQLNTWMKTYSAEKREVYTNLFSPIDILKIKNDKYNIIWDRDLDSLGNMETEWIIEQWLPKGDICFVAGKAASFKSTICLHMGYAISRGKLVFNKYKTMKSNVLYLNEENSRKILLNMVNRVKKGLGVNDNEGNNICFSVLENIRLDNIEDLKFLVDFINKNQIDVLFCDSFRRFISFDENSATETNRFFNYLKYLRVNCQNLTIIILHHLKKENSQYASDIRDSLRGSSDIVNSADSIIGIARKHGFNAFQIEHIKNRSGEELTNKLIMIESGEDKDIAYFYESDKEMDKTKFISKPEECASKVIELMKKKKMKIFARHDLKELEEEYSVDTLTKSLRILVQEETISTDDSKGGKYKKYSFKNIAENEENSSEENTTLP